jgi:hypothetical protein
MEFIFDLLSTLFDIILPEVVLGFVDGQRKAKRTEKWVTR